MTSAKIRILSFLTIFAVISTLMTSPAAVAITPDWQPYFHSKAEDILSEADLPAFSQLMAEVIKELRPAQVDLLGPDADAVQRILIVKDKDWKFDVQNEVERIDLFRFRIYQSIRVSLGALKALSEITHLDVDPSPENKIKLVKLFVWIMAHEMGHAMDYAEVFRETGTIDKASAGGVRTQKIEIKADTFAQLTAALSRLGLGTVHDSMELMDDDRLNGKFADNSYANAAGTHPPASVRMLINRLLATSRHIEQGESVNQAFFDRLSQLDFSRDLTTIEHLISPGETRGETFRDFRIDLEKRIHDVNSKGQAFSKIKYLGTGAAELEHLTTLIAKYENGQALKPADFDEANQILKIILDTDGNTVRGQASYRGRWEARKSLHIRIFETLHFYNDPRVVGLMFEHYKIADVRTLSTDPIQQISLFRKSFDYTPKVLLDLVPPKLFWKKFTPVTITNIQYLTAAHAIPFSEAQDRLSHLVMLNQDTKIESVKAAMPLMLEKSAEPTLEIAAYKPLLWTNPEFKSSVRALKVFQRQGRLSPSQAADLERLTDWFKEIWRLRGLLETEAMLAIGNSTYKTEKSWIDWRFIAEMNQVEAPQIEQMVMQATNDYLKKDGGTRLGVRNYDQILDVLKTTKINMPYSAIRGYFATSPYTISLLLGEKTESQIVDQPSAKDFVRSRISSAVPDMKKTSVIRSSQEQFRQDITARDESLVIQASNSILKNLKADVSSGLGPSRKIEVLEAAIAAIRQTQAPSEIQKNAVLKVCQNFLVGLSKNYFTPGHPKRSSVLEKMDSRKALEILVQEKLAPSYIDSLKLIPVPHEDDFRFLATKHSILLKKDIATAEAQGEFRNFNRFITIVNHISQQLASFEKSVFSTGNIHIDQLKSTLIEAAARQGFTAEQMKSLFLVLTQNSASQATDKMFEEIVFPQFKNKKRFDRELQSMLQEKRFVSENLILQNIEFAYSERIKNLAPPASAWKTQEIDNLLSDLEKILPLSLARDEYLNKLAYALPVSEDQLQRIENTKSAKSGESVSPFGIRVLSFLATKVDKLSLSQRLVFIRYLSASRKSPQPVRFPDEIWDQMLKDERVEAMALAENARTTVDSATFDPVEDFQAKEAEMKALAIGYMERATETQIIPVIDLFLKAGREKSIMNLPLWREKVIRSLLAYVPGSAEDIILKTYIEVAPGYKKSVAVAYMLGQMRSGSKGSAASIFLIFGSVGKKLGQLLADWKILPDEIAKELKNLKNHAPPLSRYQVERSMRRSLPARLFQLFRQNMKLLSAASMKTVVQVENENGVPFAMGAQSEFTNQLNQTNIDEARRFADRLIQNLSHPHGHLMQDILKAYGEQISAEENMLNELETLDEVQKKVARLVQEMDPADLKGWNIEVNTAAKDLPQNKDLIFLNFAHGTAFSDLQEQNPKVAEAVGPVLLKLSLAMLFRVGTFDADRHGGNWIIDVKNKKIYFIDAGQVERLKLGGFWSRDERVTIADFLRGIEQRDAKLVASNLRRMVTGKAGEPDLTEALSQHFLDQQTEGNGDAILNVASIAAAKGWHLPRSYLIGLLKGLLLLKNNDYVSEAEFNKMIKVEIQKLYLKKPLALVRAFADSILRPPMSCRALHSAARK